MKPLFAGKTDSNQNYGREMVNRPFLVLFFFSTSKTKAVSRSIDLFISSHFTSTPFQTFSLSLSLSLSLSFSLSFGLSSNLFSLPPPSPPLPHSLSFPSQIDWLTDPVGLGAAAESSWNRAVRTAPNWRLIKLQLANGWTGHQTSLTGS